MGCSLNGIDCPYNPEFGHHGSTKQSLKWISRIKNDYELAIRLSKELEFILETHFQATGKGLHQKITSAKQNYFHKTHRHFSTKLEKNMRRLATIRNKLIHNRNYKRLMTKMHSFKHSKIHTLSYKKSSLKCMRKERKTNMKDASYCDGIFILIL